MDPAALFDHHVDLPPPDEPLDPKVWPSHGAVCALTDERNRLIQTLALQSVRRTLPLKLEPPPDSAGRRRTDLRAVVRRVWWQPTYSQFESYLTYWRFTRQLTPQTYRQELAFGPAWFARVDPTEQFPHWTVGRCAFAPPTIDIGPFITRAACRHYVELLEDLFDLCRYPDVLRQAPGGQACAYQEMGKCPAPCDGSISLQQYQRAINASIEFAHGRTEQRIAQLERLMAEAAQRLEFERAARIREQYQRARKTLADDGRLTPTPGDFRYLIVQRAGGTTRIKPFFVVAGNLSEEAPVRLRDVAGPAARWPDKMTSLGDGKRGHDPLERSECIWLVAHFLAKGDKAPGLFLRDTEWSDPKELVRKIETRFGKARTSSVVETASVDPAKRSPLQ